MDALRSRNRRRPLCRRSANRSQLSTLNSQLLPRPAFTLIELLVAVAIFAILVTLALGAFRESDQDRAAAAAQQLRSMIEGARSRAIHDQMPRGIRLILDPNNRSTVTSIIYIGAPEQYVGVLNNLDGDTNNPAFQPGLPGVDDDMNGEPDDASEYGWKDLPEAVRDDILASVDPLPAGTPGFTPEWTIRERTGKWRNLMRRGLLTHTGNYIGARIRIPAKSQTWFPIVDVASSSMFPDDVTITIAGQYPYSSVRPYLDGTTGYHAKVNRDTVLEYVLELAPPILPGSTPQALPAGVAIDLEGSRLPPNWLNGTSFMDILFTPRGDVTGSAAAAGVINLVIADVEAISNGSRYPAPPTSPPTGWAPPPPAWAGVLQPDPNAGIVLNDRLVTLFTRTGLVTTSQVNHFDFGPTRSPYEFGLAGKDAP